MPEGYLIATAAAAAGIAPNTVRSLLQRKHVTFEEDGFTPAAGVGLPHRISLNSVMRLAIMARLLPFGMPPKRAWTITRAFTDEGEGDAGWSEEVVETGRDPGELFPLGDTVLVAYDDEDFGRVINVPPQEITFFPPDEGAKTAAVMVNVSRVVEHVRAALAGEAC